MATNDVTIRRGTPFTLASAGASGQMTFNCGSGSGIQSNTFVLGAQHAEKYEMTMEVCAAAVPVVGLSYDYYLAAAGPRGNYPGRVSGIDGTYPVANMAGLTQLNYLGSIITTANSGVQSATTIISPTINSGCIVFKNSTDIATVNLSGLITLVPLIPQLEV